MIPCVKLRIPVIWVDRKKEGWPQGQKGKPTEIVQGPALGREVAGRLDRLLGVCS